jgi:hypothetical protein
MDQRTTIFQQLRPRLYGIAYCMLGSQADAEDMLQEAYLRWYRADTDRVRSPEAWLTTTTTRLCIDRLRAARVERETYFGPWLPEPLVSEPFAASDQTSEFASDLSVAFLVSGAQIEGHAAPAPVVNVELAIGVRFGDQLGSTPGSVWSPGTSRPAPRRTYIERGRRVRARRAG